LKSLSLSAGNPKITAREILLFGFFSAVLIVVQVAKALLIPLPNIELVSLFIIVYTTVIGKKVFYIIYVFVLAEGLIFGFDPWWWISYLYVWALLAGVVLMLRENERILIWVIVSGLFGLLFGAMCSIPFLFTGGIGAAVSYWVSGIPFDFIHCAGNAAAAALLFKPCHDIMKRLYVKDRINV
jgi:energy-coupling factor transport system substrate-specific component